VQFGAQWTGAGPQNVVLVTHDPSERRQVHLSVHSSEPPLLLPPLLLLPPRLHAS
jgi:hypothetical protein